MTHQSMQLITSTWGESKSFRLIPMTLDCPFTEGIYDPGSKVLVMISRIKKETFHMLARLDEQGDQLKLKRPRTNGKPFPEERKTLETFQEYYITEPAEIEELIKMLALNADTFDYKTLVNSSGIMTPEKPKIEIVKS